jgi:hypothetical protein
MKAIQRFVGLDVHKDTLVIAVADQGRGGEVRAYGPSGDRTYTFFRWCSCSSMLETFLPPSSYLVVTTFVWKACVPRGPRWTQVNSLIQKARHTLKILLKKRASFSAEQCNMPQGGVV